MNVVNWALVWIAGAGAIGGALNALATIMLLISIIAVVLGFIVFRRMTRSDTIKGGAALDQFAAQL